jgi:hypothetical protein
MCPDLVGSSGCETHASHVGDAYLIDKYLVQDGGRLFTANFGPALEVLPA